jgi:hypothetical protein
MQVLSFFKLCFVNEYLCCNLSLKIVDIAYEKSSVSNFFMNHTLFPLLAIIPFFSPWFFELHLFSFGIAFPGNYETWIHTKTKLLSQNLSWLQAPPLTSCDFKWVV